MKLIHPYLKTGIILLNQFPRRLITTHLYNYDNNYFICDMFSGAEDNMTYDIVDSGLNLSNDQQWDAICDNGWDSF